MIDSDIFTPAAVLPEQLADGPTAPPEQRLLMAILLDAINCFQKYHSTHNRRRRRLFSDAADWLMSEQNHGPFSFEHICGVLSLDPGAVRCSLRRRQFPDSGGIDKGVE